jgi:hypothetical protein
MSSQASASKHVNIESTNESLPEFYAKHNPAKIKSYGTTHVFIMTFLKFLPNVLTQGNFYPTLTPFFLFRNF